MIQVYEVAVTQQAISKALIMNDVEIESINKKHSSLGGIFLKCNGWRRYSCLMDCG